MLRLSISALLVCLFVWSASAQTKRNSVRPTGKSGAKNAARLISDARRFSIGERVVYRIEYANRSISDFSALFKSGDSIDAPQANAAALAYSIDSGVRGELIETTIEKNAGGWLVAYAFRSPEIRLRINNQEIDAAIVDAVEENLSRAVFAQLNWQGKIVSVRFDQALDEVSLGFARSLLAYTQFVFPDAAAAKNAPLPKVWETREDDAAGVYAARYQVAASETYSKTKTKYEPRGSLPNGQARFYEVVQTIEPSGDLTARLDARSGRLLSLDGAESQTVRIAGKTIARGETDLRLVYLNAENLNAAELDALRQSNKAREKVAAAVSLSNLENAESAGEASIQRTELGGETAESLLARLAQIEASPDAAKDKTALYLKFKALVYLQPEACEKLGEILAKAEANGATALTLSGALGVVGHRQAQSALVFAARSRPNDWAFLATIIPSLGGANEPTEEAEKLVRELAKNSVDENVASTARLALGTMARNLQAKSPARAAKIVEEFVGRIRNADEKTANELLAVLGNTGSPTILPTISRYLMSEKTSLRAAAVSALRLVDGSRADALLIKILLSDADALVRLEAVNALAAREPNAAIVAAQKRAFHTDKSAPVRVAVLQNLWRARDAFPAVRQIVERAAASDAAKEVREAAANLIGAAKKF